MLFHVTAKHSYKTCSGIRHGVESDETKAFSKWMEWNEDVEGLGVWGYNVSHSVYSVIEAEDM